MRKLTDEDLKNIIGTTLQSYHVEGVRIKRGTFSDSDHYGILLGKKPDGHYVTWEFHLDENEKINAYWGHYIEDREACEHVLGSENFVQIELVAVPACEHDISSSFKETDCQCHCS